jgi:hypothetical protein
VQLANKNLDNSLNKNYDVSQLGILSTLDILTLDETSYNTSNGEYCGNDSYHYNIILNSDTLNNDKILELLAAKNIIYIEGHTGKQGIQGEQGKTGCRGPEGPRGIPGYQGCTGHTGHKGDIGCIGKQGKKGKKGDKGDPGICSCESLIAEQNTAIIITKDYKVQPYDKYIIIKSSIPRVITLYPLKDNSISDQHTKTKALHIKSLNTSGPHKIIVGSNDNTIDDEKDHHKLNSYETLTIIPIGTAWYIL